MGRKICRKKNSEKECIPNGCHTGNWIKCFELKKCPINSDEIINEADHLNNKEYNKTIKDKQFAKWQKEKYKKKKEKSGGLI